MIYCYVLKLNANFIYCYIRSTSLFSRTNLSARQHDKKILNFNLLSNFGFSGIMVKDSDIGGNDKQWNSARESFLYL